MLVKNKTFSIVTLGCRTNGVESNAINNQLTDSGMINVNDINKSEICIVNTCCVTKRAEAKSRYSIMKATRSKLCKVVIIVGCYSQINKNLILDRKVGIVLGTKYKSSLINYLKKYDGVHPIIAVNNFSNKDKFENYVIENYHNNTRAFLKIQDGCNFMCSYCVIPFARGRQRSLSHKKIIETIKKLVSNGYKEIVLTGVNTAGYFENKNYQFYDLLCDINLLSGSFRVRISSLEPFQINHKIIDLITTNKERWCQHFHICIQSACNQIISDMKRKYTITAFIELCRYIRSKNKMVSITTDLIVGFPTESNDCFKESLINLKLINFSDMHIFPFSLRPFTAAAKLKNIVSDQQKTQRFTQMSSLNKMFKNQYLNTFRSQTVKVLFEKSTDINYQSGHSEYFFNVKVKTNKHLTNEFHRVKITRIIDNQAFGVLI
ncbi:MAG: tRNA (N(6)-L-threonylcarbamoyladenosine(37)-C(2))-methylthiotransferase MtaB [Mycoplasmataceae bacterium]|jgi:threonylcarbamoyladenosine tRNA methylthiotransferase MtaB|nr:tRNA (N(6)-L-threonylcarbamoyladenosine(37)-C(2))-methylthiotransferase MtaB [Mycoplasmataceae bacterium]